MALAYYAEGDLTGATKSGGADGNGKTIYYWIVRYLPLCVRRCLVFGLLSCVSGSSLW